METNPTSSNTTQPDTPPNKPSALDCLLTSAFTRELLEIGLTSVLDGEFSDTFTVKDWFNAIVFGYHKVCRMKGMLADNAPLTSEKRAQLEAAQDALDEAERAELAGRIDDRDQQMQRLFHLLEWAKDAPPTTSDNSEEESGLTPRQKRRLLKELLACSEARQYALIINARVSRRKGILFFDTASMSNSIFLQRDGQELVHIVRGSLQAYIDGLEAEAAADEATEGARAETETPEAGE